MDKEQEGLVFVGAHKGELHDKRPRALTAHDNKGHLGANYRMQCIFNHAQ